MPDSFTGDKHNTRDINTNPDNTNGRQFSVYCVVLRPNQKVQLGQGMEKRFRAYKHVLLFQRTEFGFHHLHQAVFNQL